MLQSLTTTAPIFVLTEYLNIDENALELLKKRALCFKKTTELTEALNMYLQGKYNDVKIDLENKEFLKTYGIHCEMGRCKAEAVKVMKNAIVKKSSAKADNTYEIF